MGQDDRTELLAPARHDIPIHYPEPIGTKPLTGPEFFGSMYHRLVSDTPDTLRHPVRISLLLLHGAAALNVCIDRASPTMEIRAEPASSCNHFGLFQHGHLSSGCAHIGSLSTIPCVRVADHDHVLCARRDGRLRILLLTQDGIHLAGCLGCVCPVAGSHRLEIHLTAAQLWTTCVSNTGYCPLH